jgi:hypothetical protein
MYGMVFEPFIVFTGTVWSPIVNRNTHTKITKSYLGYQSLTTFLTVSEIFKTNDALKQKKR